jgi:hypothetical protein
MKIVPNTKGGWIALILVPFKDCIVLACPFVLACAAIYRLITPQYRSWGWRFEEAIRVVSEYCI